MKIELSLTAVIIIIFIIIIMIVDFTLDKRPLTIIGTNRIIETVKDNEVAYEPPLIEPPIDTIETEPVETTT